MAAVTYIGLPSSWREWRYVIVAALATLGEADGPWSSQDIKAVAVGWFEPPGSAATFSRGFDNALGALCATGIVNYEFEGFSLPEWNPNRRQDVESPITLTNHYGAWTTTGYYLDEAIRLLLPASPNELREFYKANYGDEGEDYRLVGTVSELLIMLCHKGIVDKLRNSPGAREAWQRRRR